MQSIQCTGRLPRSPEVVWRTMLVAEYCNKRARGFSPGSQHQGDWGIDRDSDRNL